MMFLGSKHCPRCGAPADRKADVESAGRKCPRCLTEMQIAQIGDSKVLECASCLGLWLTKNAFETICADKEQQSAVLGTASLKDVEPNTPDSKVRYVPCPECSQLMNRANFARCSGVIVDLCKPHGVWFDPNELSRIVEFIRAGGLEISRAREKTALEDERRRVQQEQIALDMQRSRMTDLGNSERSNGIASAGSLLKLLIGSRCS